MATPYSCLTSYVMRLLQLVYDSFGKVTASRAAPQIPRPAT